MNTNRVLTALVLGALLTLTGCKKEAEEALPSVVGGITASDIVKSWSSDCTATVAPDPITGAGYFKTYYTFNSNSTFDAYEMYYTASNCLGGSLVTYFTAGSFAVQAVNGAPSGTFAIAFGVGSSSVMAMVDATQTAFNSKCGGTTPYTNPITPGDTGQHKDSYHGLSCTGGITFAASNNTGFVNLATFSGGVLSIANHGNTGLPGIASGGSLPSSAAIVLH